MSEPRMTYISELAPMGKLRVGINFGNALLANKDAGTPGGIAVDLAQELTRRVGLPMELVSYDTAGRMADGAKAGAWDVAFLAADPARAEEITFTAPYLEIDDLPGPGRLAATDIGRCRPRGSSHRCVGQERVRFVSYTKLETCPACARARG